MKVYLITSGEYSDYHVDAVSLDEKEAERICATFNNGRCSDMYCNIEEYDTEDIKVITQDEVKTRFCMCVEYKSGETRCFNEMGLVSENVNEISVKRYDGSDKIEITATLPKGTTEDKAKKIMFDRIARFKAERASI